MAVARLHLRRWNGSPDRNVEAAQSRFRSDRAQLLGLSCRDLPNHPAEPSRRGSGHAGKPAGSRAAMHMQLHWDGNNDSVEERNRSAGFGTGAVPTNIDRKSLTFIANWLRSDANQPPKYPLPIDSAIADRGKALYGEYCSACHGA